jgi:ketosteroid isomerase-like protein
MKNGKADAELKAALGEFAAAYQEKRLDKLMSLMAPGTEIVLSHGGEQRRLAGAQLRAHLEKRWAEAGSAKATVEAKELSHMGSLALVSADTTMDLLGAKGEKHAQLTAGLERFGNRWLFSQLHFSQGEARKAEK